MVNPIVLQINISYTGTCHKNVEMFTVVQNSKVIVYYRREKIEPRYSNSKGSLLGFLSEVF
jgi:hypothetical protein